MIPITWFGEYSSGEIQIRPEEFFPCNGEQMKILLKLLRGCHPSQVNALSLALQKLIAECEDERKKKKLISQLEKVIRLI